MVCLRQDWDMLWGECVCVGGDIGHRMSQGLESQLLICCVPLCLCLFVC
jgi:hypothetical protein